MDMPSKQVKRIYVASSWRCMMQPAIVAMLRAAKFEVYDFKNPKEGDNGFHWSELDSKYKTWTAEKFIYALKHPISEAGFKSDFDAMQWADTCVLVLPCNRSAHLEAGWFVGNGRQLHILIEPDGFEPELMYKMADSVSDNTMDLLAHLGVKD